MRGQPQGTEVLHDRRIGRPPERLDQSDVVPQPPQPVEVLQHRPSGTALPGIPRNHPAKQNPHPFAHVQPCLEIESLTRIKSLFDVF
jgi:hypothetical protein